MSQSTLARENDRLRAEALDLRAQIDDLTARAEELETQLATATAVTATATAPDEVLASTPQVVRLAIGKLSHAADENGDGVAELLRVYVEPKDGRGRMIQLVGTLTVHAVVIPKDADAKTIGRVTLSPAQVRDAYRSGVTGTHYTIEVPIEGAGLIGKKGKEPACHVRVEFVDGYTGRAVSAERTLALEER